MVSLLLCSVDWSDVDKASRSCTRPLISHAGRLLAAAELLLLLLPLDEADDRDEVGGSTLARLALGAAVLDVELLPHNHAEIEIEIIRCENRKAKASEGEGGHTAQQRHARQWRMCQLAARQQRARHASSWP